MAGQCFCMNHWHPSSFGPLYCPVRTVSQRLSLLFFFSYTKELSPYPPNLPLFFSSKGNLALRISIKKRWGNEVARNLPQGWLGWRAECKGELSMPGSLMLPTWEKLLKHIKYCIPSSCAASLAERFSSHLKLFIGVIPTAHARGRWSEHVGFMCHSSTWHNGPGLLHWT